MKTTSETGHAKNVANFEDLISFCTGYGTSYNPTKTAIQLSSLTTLHSDALAALSNLNALLSAYTIAVDQREALFEPVSKRLTRVMNAVHASSLTKEVKEDVRSLERRLQGLRAKSKKALPNQEANTPEEVNTKTVSISHMSYDQRLENLDKLIQLLSTQTDYQPNESDLGVPALNTLINDLRSANTAVANAFMSLSNGRIARNELLYAKDTGLFDIVADVKKYIKSVFGATSPQYRQVSKIKFSKLAF